MAAIVLVLFMYLHFVLFEMLVINVCMCGVEGIHMPCQGVLVGVREQSKFVESSLSCLYVGSGD